MSNHENHQDTNNSIVDPFLDPVGYLAAFGIEAELVAFVSTLPEAA